MKFNERFMLFMRGRYGIDSFSRFLLFFALIFYIFNIFMDFGIFSILPFALLCYCYFRLFSKNIHKRAKENQIFLQKTVKIRQALYKYQNQLKDRKTHHIYSCPNCKQKIRIPRGKGRISIHCPSCHTDFVKKS